MSPRVLVRMLLKCHFVQMSMQPITLANLNAQPLVGVDRERENYYVMNPYSHPKMPYQEKYVKL